MLALPFFIIIILIIAAIIIFVSFCLYNKRLQKIADGELRDTHTRIPEPGTTAGITYRTVLIGLAIIAILGISSINGLIRSLNNNMNDLSSKQYELSLKLTEMQNQMEQRDRMVSDFTWEITDKDVNLKTAGVTFWVDLKQYSDNTAVTLALKEREIPLTKTGPGTFSGTATLDIFEGYDIVKICIRENDVTRVENMDFYQSLFLELFPMPRLECSFSVKEANGKMKCNGSYKFSFDNRDQIKKVKVTLLGDGKEIQTFDATDMAKDDTRIELEKNTTVEKDLVLQLEVITNDDYKLVQRQVLVYSTSAGSDEDYERIYDRDGNQIWENEK